MNKVLTHIFLFLMISTSIFAVEKWEIYPPGAVDDNTSLDIEPVGWGPQGLFAYIKDTSHSWKGTESKTYIIYSLVNDSIVWSLETESEPDEDEAAEQGRVMTAYKKFNDEMKKFGMYRGDFEMLDHFPYRPDLDGPLLQVYLTIADSSSDEDFCATNYHYNYQVIAQLGNKKKQISSGEKSSVIFQEILGFLRHPQEDRIAVIIKTVHASLECERTVTYDIIGCHTRKGYK